MPPHVMVLAVWFVFMTFAQCNAVAVGGACLVLVVFVAHERRRHLNLRDRPYR